MAKGLKLNKVEVGDYAVSVQRSGLPMIAMQKTVTAATLTEFNEAVGAGKMRLALPIIGFRQKISIGAQGEIEKQILADERLNPESFKINAMPLLTTKGELRTAITPLNDFSLNGVFRDLTNPSRNKANIGFTLHRGSYATIVLRELMKTRNPIVAGF
jgi:tRNA pseudouridine13 synthase